MRVLVTGSNGFIASSILKLLDDYEVRLFDKNRNIHNDYTDFIQSSINDIDNLYSSVIDIDVVIHCAGRAHIIDETSVNPQESFDKVNFEGTVELAKQAAKAGVKRFIFISSIKVNGTYSDETGPFTENHDRNPYIKDYAACSKAKAEISLLNISKQYEMELVIIRSPLVYGPGVKANFANLMKLVSKGLPLPFGCIKNNKRSLVSVANLSDLIVTCINHPKAAGEIFLVSDDQDISTTDLIQKMREALDISGYMLPIPAWIFIIFGKVTGKEEIVKNLVNSLQVDISYTKKTLGWEPPQSIDIGLAQTAQEFLNTTDKSFKL